MFVCLRLGDVAFFFVVMTHDQHNNVHLLVSGDPGYLFKFCKMVFNSHLTGWETIDLLDLLGHQSNKLIGP